MLLKVKMLISTFYIQFIFLEKNHLTFQQFMFLLCKMSVIISVTRDHFRDK